MNFSAGIRQACNLYSQQWAAQSPALHLVTQHNRFASEPGFRFTVLCSRFDDIQMLP